MRDFLSLHHDDCFVRDHVHIRLRLINSGDALSIYIEPTDHFDAEHDRNSAKEIDCNSL